MLGSRNGPQNGGRFGKILVTGRKIARVSIVAAGTRQKFSMPLLFHGFAGPQALVLHTLRTFMATHVLELCLGVCGYCLVLIRFGISDSGKFNPGLRTCLSLITVRFIAWCPRLRFSQKRAARFALKRLGLNAFLMRSSLIADLHLALGDFLSARALRSFPTNIGIGTPIRRNMHVLKLQLASQMAPVRLSPVRGLQPSLL